MLETPVAVVIHRRPVETREVLRQIARAQPRRLLVIADAPRTSAEEVLCRAARAVVDEFDWEGEVLTNFASESMGLQRRAVSGLDWVFEQCEEAIILEDDCVPSLDFFRFCTELLERYRAEVRVKMISGNDLRFGAGTDRFSYRFSRYPGLWGWASWRRAWDQYDRSASAWATLREGDTLDRLLGDPAAAAAWRQLLDPLYPSQTSTTWDHQWVVTCWANDGLSIAPSVNLVTNIGFGPGASHFVQRDERLSLPAGEMSFPLRHPPDLAVDRHADHLTFRNTLGTASPPVRLLTPFVRRLPMPVRQALRRAYARASR